ncbi:hypothetical protein GE09DRAFT_1110129 [Coniochaeta sp. 2T2.1]|nr:hypothetical protein GE09DRAFT_1110129 [Coniochaeta sp. 2T2.1]
MTSPEERDDTMVDVTDPFADEPTLPQLPYLPQEPSRSDASGRKRSYPFKAPGTEALPSSDIGVFSSDDDPALDNYVRARQKRRYRGTWYDHNRMMSESDAPPNEDDSHPEEVVPETPRAKGRASGSQETGARVFARAHSGAGHPPPTPPASNPLHTHTFTPNRRFPSSQGFSPGQIPPSSQALPSSQSYDTVPARKQRAVRQAIETCIDRGESVIDLANNLDDESLSVDTFRPLIELSLVPHVQAREPTGRSRDPLTTSKDGYLHKESKIVLIMANNRLTRLPGTLFSIENLVDLSLRHNQLTELPATIAQCKSLRSLNLSFNRLRYLPFELVERLPLFTTLNLAGNDFYEPCNPDDPYWLAGEEGFDLALLPSHFVDEFAEPGDDHFVRLAAWYVGRGPVQYSDTAGRIYSRFRLPLAGGPQNLVPLELGKEHAGPLSRHQGESQSRAGTTIQPTRVPSLVELCTRSLAKSGRPEDYGDMTSEPEFLERAVTAASSVRYSGGQSCAVCKKAFVNPRTQWVEFFFYEESMIEAEGQGGDHRIISDGMEMIRRGSKVVDNAIPCLRRGCSWKCVPYQRGLSVGYLVQPKV